ncbi:MAG: T9SS type A sorting domain-containing protein [Bacteroidales bacterium]|nr:T9SS type A sorting domain-containing protein [Bacteroidales bacterium]
MKIKTFILTFLLMSCPFLFGQNHWTPIKNTSSENMNAFVKVNIAGQPQTANVEVGAFIDNVCYGSAILEDGYAFLTICKPASVTSNTISLKLYYNGNEYVLKETLTYAANNTPDIENPTVLETAAVAESNGLIYETLADAVAAAADGETVTLLANETSDKIIEIKGDVVIDLNSNTVEGTANRLFRITAASEVTISNGTILNEVSGGRCIETRTGNVTLNLNEVELIAKNGASQPLTVGGYGNNIVVNAKSSKISAGTGYGITTFNPVVMTLNATEVSGYGALNIKLASSSVGSAGSVFNIVNGSELIGTNNAAEGETNSFSVVMVEDKNIEINVENSTLKAVAQNNPQAIFGLGNEYVTEAITGLDINVNANSTLALDGEKEASILGLHDNQVLGDNSITVPATCAEQLRSEGWVVSEATNGLVTVLGTPVAAIGDTKYHTLASALTAAQANDVITFLADITEDVTVGKNVTINGASKTYTGKMTLTNKADITIKNVNFDGKGYNGYAVQGGGAYYVTIEDCTAKNYGYGFVQLASGTVLTTVKNVTVSNMNYGVKVDYSNAVVLENVDITADVAAVLNSNYGDKTITIKDSKLNKLGTWKRKDTFKTTYVFEGDNTVGEFQIEASLDSFKLALGATLTAPNDITATAKEDGYIVKYEDGKYIVVRGLKGSGTEDDPFVIMTIEDLIFFRDEVNTVANSKYNAPGVYVALGADINMTGVNWVGIGSATADHGFMGNFDGKNFKIKNLTITDPTLDSDGYAYAGLFAVTEGTDKDNQNTIKNLTIENVTITTTGHIVSAAIAYPYYTIVDNVKVCGNIKIEGGDYTSGILAYTRRCVNASNLSIVGNEGSFVEGNQVVGGVISNIQMNGGLIADYDNFSAQGIAVKGIKNVGGISGIIATQTLDGASVKNVTLSGNAGVGVVSGVLGGPSTISNVVFENVTGATAVVGATYDNHKAVEARIVDTYYATFNNAYTAAENGNTITVLNPVVITENNKSYDLTGINVVGDVYPMFRIQNGATATFNGGNFENGDYVFTLGEGASAEDTFGNLVINGGKYHGETTVANVVKGNLTINGGEFSAEPAPAEYTGDYRYLINCYDASYSANLATVAIYGGTFHNWNPEDNKAESEHTNFCAEGFSSLNAAENVWMVKPVQTIELKKDWNWVSQYVIGTDYETVFDQLQTKIGANGIEIKAQVGMLRYEDGEWDGSLESTTPSEMYKINVNADKTIKIVGDIVNPEDYAITLAYDADNAYNWNYIGLPMDRTISVADAFASVVKSKDIVKSQGQFAQYFNNQWWGSLKNLEPGVGYMYERKVEGATFKFTYPTQTRGAVEANITTENNHWVPAGQYANNMSMVATLGANSENYELAAFVNGEVRGSARPIYVDVLDTYMFFLTINGNDIEEVTFKCYDINTNTEYTLGERINYSNNAILGSVEEPVVLRGTLGMGEVSANAVAIYPNPATTSNDINLATTCDKVEVFNALGVKVAEYQNVDTIDALEAAGVYVIRVTNNGNTQNCRLVVK